MAAFAVGGLLEMEDERKNIMKERDDGSAWVYIYKG